MKIIGPFHWTQVAVFLLFGLIFASTSALLIETIDRNLTRQNRTNIEIVARALAVASTDVLVNRDLAALQATIDRFKLLGGIRYIYVADAQGEMISHTFVPGIPPALLQADLAETGTLVRSIASGVQITEISVPMLAGYAGTVHVGLEPGLIRTLVQQAVGQQVYLISALYILCILVCIYLFRRASRPLEQLGQQLAQQLEPQATPVLAPEAWQKLLQRDDLVGQLARRIRALERTAGSRENKG
jgi:hypothetical protein